MGDETKDIFKEEKKSLFPTPRPFQDKAHEMLREGYRNGHRKQLICSGTGSGKCLGRDTPVLLKSGRIKMVHDIFVGDVLIGPDGRGRNVLSTCSGIEQLYRIIPMKGDPYVVNESHILSMKRTGTSNLTLADGSVIYPFNEVVNLELTMLMRSNKTVKHCLKGWRSPAVEFELGRITSFVTPYWLGSWLGDGSSNQPTLHKPPCRMTDEWCDEAGRNGHRINHTVDGRKCDYWRIKRPVGGVNLFTKFLVDNNLIGNKHIPDEFKYASIDDRLELIAGLLDSDGHMERGGYDWISSRKVLAEDFAFLCRSVGLAAYVKECTKGIKAVNFSGTYWRVSVSGDCERIPCRDKIAPPRQQKKRHLVHSIQIEDAGVGEYFGFEIDGDRLFLLGDFTVTHNTVLALRIIKEATDRGRSAMFICDRTTLINQTSDVASRFGMAHGVIQADHWRKNNELFQIASAQTLARRKWAPREVTVVDEAHTLMKPWVDLIKNDKSGLVVIGLSATPFSKGLGKLYTNVINAASIHELTRDGYLVPMRVFSCRKPDMSGAETLGGEWSAEAAGKRGMEIIGDVVTEWFKYGENDKTIVFGATIEHCNELCRQFNEAGVLAAVYTSKTDEATRLDLLEEFKDHDTPLRVLCTVEALAKGYDQSDVVNIVDCRPLRKSLSSAIQMWGRGARISPETGKRFMRLLDFSGNYIRFLEDYEDFYYNGIASLDDGEKLDKEIRKEEKGEERACPNCGHRPFVKRCIACGHESKSLSLIQHQPGEMVEITIGRDKKKAADSPEHLWAQLATYVRQSGKVETQRQRAFYLYRDIMGRSPPEHFSVGNAPVVDITPAVIGKIRSRQIAYSKGMQKGAKRA